MQDDEPITLQSDDGAEHRCRVLGVFEYESREYALLLDLGEPAVDATSEPETVLMRLLDHGGKAVFSTIEDDAEFDRVTTYIKELACDLDAEEVERN